MSDAVLKYGEPENYVNRELSWLEFNYRILGEARDKTTPLFERLKFLSITASNLDEFFMVRVASLKDMVHANYTKRDIAGMTAQEQLDAIDGKTHELVENQYRTYNRMLLPLLKQHGLRVVTEHEKLTKEEAVYVDRYFEESVYPVLTPMAVDSSRPFPLIHNKSLNIAALVRKKKGDGELEFAMVCVPGGLPRVVELPCQEGKSIIYLEEVIERNIDKLFLNYDIISCHPFRVMRNADLSIDEDEAEDLLKEIEQKLKKRQWGEVIRLDIEKKADKRLLDILKKELHVGGHAIYEIDGPLDLTVLMKVFGLPGFDEFKTPPYTPQPVPALMNEDDIFANIREGDILLTHPFETFEPVVNFIKKAARDPEVLAIITSIYSLATELLKGNRRQALLILDDLIAQKIEPVVILAALSSNYIDFYRAKTAQGAGKSSQQTADDFGYAKNRTFVVTKAMNLVSRLDTEHIRNCLDILFNADLALKTSAINYRTVLEETIVKLSPEKSRRSYY